MDFKLLPPQLRLRRRNHIRHLRRLPGRALNQKRALQRAEDKPGHFCGRFRKPEFAARGAAPEDRPEPLLMRLEKSRDPLMMN